MNSLTITQNDADEIYVPSSMSIGASPKRNLNVKAHSVMGVGENVPAGFNRRRSVFTKLAGY